MKSKNKVLIKKGAPLPSKIVEQYMEDWQKCLPIQLGDLFTFTKAGSEGTKRYDTYTLKPSYLKRIIHLYNGTKKHPKNVKNLRVIMGKKKDKKRKKAKLSEPSNDIFIPILEVSLFKSVGGKNNYYFEMSPEEESFDFNAVVRKKKSISTNSITRDLEESISPKVAELFIVKWQAIGDVELISAFDCLAPEGISTGFSRITGNDQTLFLQQKLKRVEKYTFSQDETSSIFDTIIKMYNSSVVFKVNLGAGLTVADYHPFSFRPIITIEQLGLAKRDIEAPPVTYFDTSRPCPPYCGE